MAMVEGPLRLPSLPVFLGVGEVDGEDTAEGEDEAEDEGEGERVEDPPSSSRGAVDEEAAIKDDRVVDWWLGDGVGVKMSRDEDKGGEVNPDSDEDVDVGLLPRSPVVGARLVEYSGSKVPLRPGQSTLKEPIFILVHVVVGTRVALSLQDRLLGPEYAVTVPGAIVSGLGCGERDGGKGGIPEQPLSMNSERALLMDGANSPHGPSPASVSVCIVA